MSFVNSGLGRATPTSSPGGVNRPSSVMDKGAVEDIAFDDLQPLKDPEASYR